MSSCQITYPGGSLIPQSQRLSNPQEKATFLKTFAICSSCPRVVVKMLAPCARVHDSPMSMLIEASWAHCAR